MEYSNQDGLKYPGMIGLGFALLMRSLPVVCVSNNTLKIGTGAMPQLYRKLPIFFLKNDCVICLNMCEAEVVFKLSFAIWLLLSII